MCAQALDILFIIDPLESLHLETDTTFALMKEAQRRDHTVWIAYLSDLRIEGSIPHGKLTHFKTHSRFSWKKLGTKESRLDRMSVICMRKDPPFSIDYIMATSLLSLVNREKTFIMNDPMALRNFNEKLGIFEFPRYIPETIVSKTYTDHIAFLTQHKKVVLKPLEGFGGNEIFVLDHRDKNRNSLLEVMTHYQSRYIMSQRYLSAVQKGDTRVLVLDGEILAIQRRVAAPDDHRSNISAGGISHRGKLTRLENKICVEIASKLAQKGIYFAGIDIIGGYITEINVTSPTGLVKINEHEGTHLERNVLDFLEQKASHTLS